MEIGWGLGGGRFVDGEFRRLQSLLKTAGAQYGGQRYELDMGGGNVWSDNEEIIVASKKDKKRAKKEKKRSKQEGERGGDKDGVGSPSDEDNDAENGNQVEFKRRRQASILQFVKKKK